MNDGGISFTFILLFKGFLLKYFVEGPNSTTALTMHIFITMVSITLFVHSTYCIAFCVLLRITDTSRWIKIAWYLPFLVFESILSPDIMCYIQNSTSVWCRLYRTSPWIVIFKFQIVSQASDFLKEFLSDFGKELVSTLLHPGLIPGKGFYLPYL